MKKTSIREAIPKSVREKVLRRLRVDSKTAKKARKEPHIVGRMTPKKSANNDPIARGFQKKNLKENEKQLIIKIVESIVSFGLGGWKQDGDNLINESGRSIDSKKWESKDGELQLNGEKINLDTDKLYRLKEIVEQDFEDEWGDDTSGLEAFDEEQVEATLKEIVKKVEDIQQLANSLTEMSPTLYELHSRWIYNLVSVMHLFVPNMDFLSLKTNYDLNEMLNDPDGREKLRKEIERLYEHNTKRAAQHIKRISKFI